MSFLLSALRNKTDEAAGAVKIARHENSNVTWKMVNTFIVSCVNVLPCFFMRNVYKVRLDEQNVRIFLM